jgi:spore coat polysaccharide biosynthesis protein SpsF (cytidylyltransferase family)
MRTRDGIILQARFGSSRLPGKALERIGARTLLEHCLARMLAAGVARVVLATTTNVEDDALTAVAGRMGVSVFRGDANDVLGRYAAAAAQFGFDRVVRATGDNPVVDISAPGRLLGALRAHGVDYVSEDGLPCGGGVEAMTVAALRHAAETAIHPEDREHVTPYIRRSTQRFRVLQVTAPAPLRRPELRVTVDTSEDLARMRELFARTGTENPALRQIIEAAGRSPQSEVA